MEKVEGKFLLVENMMWESFWLLKEFDKLKLELLIVRSF
jgi:hypothetical protein